MSATYSIFTSPNHPPVPDHLPTLIVTPHGKPSHVLYTYLHTSLNRENYLLTPSEAGDLCVAKLFPRSSAGPGAGGSGQSSSSHASSGGSGGASVLCEASRNLRWTVSQTGIQNPVYKLTLPNPDTPSVDQPLFQVSKPNPHAPYWSLFYFVYAGHLIPPRRVEFGRIAKNSMEQGGGTRLAVTGKSEEEKAVWKTLGEGNEDMVEWVLVCAALVVLDDEITSGLPSSSKGRREGTMRPANPFGARPPPQIHPTGSRANHPVHRGTGNAPLSGYPAPNAGRVVSGPPGSMLPPPMSPPPRLPPGLGDSPSRGPPPPGQSPQPPHMNGGRQPVQPGYSARPYPGRQDSYARSDPGSVPPSQLPPGMMPGGPGGRGGPGPGAGPMPGMPQFPIPPPAPHQQTSPQRLVKRPPPGSSRSSIEGQPPPPPPREPQGFPAQPAFYQMPPPLHPPQQHYQQQNGQLPLPGQPGPQPSGYRPGPPGGRMPSPGPGQQQQRNVLHRSSPPSSPQRGRPQQSGGQGQYNPYAVPPSQQGQNGGSALVPPPSMQQVVNPPRRNSSTPANAAHWAAMQQQLHAQGQQGQGQQHPGAGAFYHAGVAGSRPPPSQQQQGGDQGGMLGALLSPLSINTDLPPPPPGQAANGNRSPTLGGYSERFLQRQVDTKRERVGVNANGPGR